VTSLSELKFFKTPKHDCSYLPGEQAVTLFADPLATIDTSTYTSLSAAGFRRSGSHIYRPFCESCNACVPVRVPVKTFVQRRKHKRVIKRNQDIEIHKTPPKLRNEYFELYERYINERHADGDMYPADLKQFESFLVKGREETMFYEFRDNNKQLVAIAVADKLLDGLSAIYTFFEPNDRSRSLGVYAILWLIEEAYRLNLDNVYLGYWIKDSQKMDYKIEYKPIELYIKNKWISIPS
tara:strand:+ start:405 stop:1118 length:714 start_codon:yes stop_codon:yes gene_type:complete